MIDLQGAQTPNMSSTVEWQGVSKTFGTNVVLDAVSLRAEPGRLLCLLGPSGCGKTTLLRMLAGFLAPDQGRVLIDGRDITDLPPHKRNTAMVFQSYALWPHMTVFDNVAYGLVEARVPRPERARRVGEILDMVRLGSFAGRKPLSLSGGQQQRVALARALVVNPAVVLLDEPLSNLDLVLRVELRQVIRELQERLKQTMVYVTHDRVEALELSHRIAVLQSGRIQQFGSPRDIYRTPANAFVAGFLGDTNLIPATVAEHAGTAVLLGSAVGRFWAEVPGGEFGMGLKVGMAVVASIRPESFRRLLELDEPRAQESVLEAVLKTVYDRGETCLLHVAGKIQPAVADADGETVRVDSSAGPAGLGGPAGASGGGTAPVWRALVLNPPELAVEAPIRFAVHARDVVVMRPTLGGNLLAAGTGIAAAGPAAMGGGVA